MAKKIINVVYKVDNKDLKETDKVLNDLEKDAKDADNAVKGFGTSSQSVFNGLTKIIAAVGIATLGKKIFDITAEFQKLGAVLTNTLGSRSAAQKALKDIQQFASTTPFSVVELTNSFVKLANQGFKPTISELRRLGDLASSQGKSFDQLTEAIIDAQTGEFERLKEFGIRASKEGDKVSFTFKGVKNQVDFTNKSIREYILSLGNLQGVSGGMAAISETFGGKLSNLGDNIDSLLASIGESNSGLIGGVLDFANNALGALNDALNDSVGALQNEQFELNALVGAATAANAEESVRAALITELNRKYPDFLKNLNLETVTNEQLTKRLSDVNEQFIRKIALQATEEKFLDTQKEIVDNVAEEIRIRKQIEALKAGRRPDETIKDLIFFDRSLTAQERILKLEESIKDVQEERKILQSNLASDLTEFNNALGIFKTTTNDYFETVDKVVDKTSNKIKTLKNVSKEFNDFLAAQSELEIFNEKAFLRILQEGRKRDLDEEKKKAEEEVEINKKKNEKEKEDDDRAREEKRQKDQIAFDGALNIIGTLLTANQLSNDAEIAAEHEKTEERLRLAGDNERAKEQIQLQSEERQKELRRRQVEEEKQATVRRILIEGALNAVKALGLPPIPGANFVAAAFALGQAAAQAIVVRGFKKGEVSIDGPGTGTSDSIPAMISKGESVINADATSKSKNLLEAINDKRIDDRILTRAAKDGGSQAQVFDDSRIVKEIKANKVNFNKEGYTLYQTMQVGSNLKRKTRAKIQGY